MNDLNNLTSALLFFNLVFHVRHFNAPNHSVHVVLDEVYRIFDSFSDEIGEQYLALNKSSTVIPNYFPAPGWNNSFTMSDIALLELAVDFITFFGVGLKDQPSVSNIIDARLSELNGSLYKLRLAYKTVSG